MNTPVFDWSSFWDDKARSGSDFQATGRGRMDIVGFLYTLREIAEALRLEKSDRLLDLGCGTGIVALALSPWVASIHGADISPQMIARARDNCRDLPHVSFCVGSMPDALDAGPFHKLLAYSVLQYLRDEDAVLDLLRAAHQALVPGGTAFFAANPDPARKGSYLEKLRGLGLNAESMALSLRITDETLWLSDEALRDLARTAGFEPVITPISPRIWQHFYMSNLVLRKPS